MPDEFTTAIGNLLRELGRAARRRERMTVATRRGAGKDVDSLKRANVARPPKEPSTSTYAGRTAARLRALRIETGQSVEGLAKKIGVATSTLYAWENGNRDIDLSAVPAICKALRTDPAGFFPAK